MCSIRNSVMRYRVLEFPGAVSLLPTTCYIYQPSGLSCLHPWTHSLEETPMQRFERNSDWGRLEPPCYGTSHTNGVVTLSICKILLTILKEWSPCIGVWYRLNY